MNRLDAMDIFVKVAELASFTKAAENLSLPKASVSTTIQQLENHLGVRLLQRTTRRVELTHDGLAFYERAKDLLADMEELEGLFQQGSSNLNGRLRVDMPSGIARNLIFPRLPEFSAKYPDLQLEISSTDRRVDLIREGFDCVIRVGKLSDSSLIARKVGTLSQVNCVSPAYLKLYGIPESLEDLASHQLIHYLQEFGGKSSGFEYLHKGGARSIAMSGSLSVNNSIAYLSACLAGFGIAQIPVVGVKDYLRTGELLEILPEFRAESLPVSLVYPNRRNLSKRVQVFMEWVCEQLKDYVDV